jgi:hypothetical protein
MHPLFVYTRIKQHQQSLRREAEPVGRMRVTRRGARAIRRAAQAEGLVATDDQSTYAAWLGRYA